MRRGRASPLAIVRDRPASPRRHFRAACVVLLALVARTGLAATVAERLGHPADSRLLVIHADDLGMAHAVNLATFEALEQGWITSASVMVPCPWFPEVAAWAKSHPEADLGVHLTLTSEWPTLRWRPLLAGSGTPSLVDPDGFLPRTGGTVAERAKRREVERELRAQIDAARAAGIAPTHFDSHMASLFGSKELFSVYRDLGERYRLPLLLERRRERGGWTVPWDSGARRDALVDLVLTIWKGARKEEWRAAYEEILAPLPPGVYQLLVHLGRDVPELQAATAGQEAYGAAWRQADFDAVRSPEFRTFLREQGFVLVSWRDLARAGVGPPAGRP